MRLKDYLKAEGVSLEEFAQRVGVQGLRMVQRWASGERMPFRLMMARIGTVTQGAVHANNFYPEGLAISHG